MDLRMRLSMRKMSKDPLRGHRINKKRKIIRRNNRLRGIRYGKAKKNERKRESSLFYGYGVEDPLEEC